MSLLDAHDIPMASYRTIVQRLGGGVPSAADVTEAKVALDKEIVQLGDQHRRLDLPSMDRISAADLVPGQAWNLILCAGRES